MPRQTGPANRVASPRRVLPALLLLTASALALPAPAARAGITQLETSKSVFYSQTSATQPTTPGGAFFNGFLTYQNPTDVASVTAVTSNGNVTYTNQPASSFFSYGPPTFATPAAMDVAFVPGSSYTITASGGTLGTQMASFNLANDTYSSVPFLTGSSYASLQGLNAASADTLGINGYTLPTGATEGFVFATITRVSDGSVAYSQGFLPTSTTSLTIAAGTLAANTAYNLELDYSVRDDTPNVGFNGAELFQLFDQRTEIAFTTAAAAVPEPASLALTGIGVTSAVLVLRRRRSKPSA